MSKSLVLGIPRGSMIVAFERAKAALAKHEATERPNDNNVLSVMDWYSVKAKLAGRVEAFKECIAIIDREIES